MCARSRVLTGGFELPTTIVEGERNTTLHRYASSLQSKGHADADIVALVDEANETRCTEPLPQSEVDAIVRHVLDDYQKGLRPDGSRAGGRVAEGAVIVKADADATPYQSFIDARRCTNDAALSALFKSVYDGRFLYVVEMKCWYAFDGKRWKPDTGGAAAMNACRSLVAELLRAVNDKIYADAVIGDATGVDKTLITMQTAISRYLDVRKRKQVLEDAQARMAASADVFDRDKNLLNVQNGTLDLETFELRPHDPADLLTKVTGASYDPRADCTRWMDLVTGLFRDDIDVVSYVQRQFGATVGGITSQERMHIVLGRPRTGKSSFFEPLVAALGDYAATIAPETLAVARGKRGADASPDLARLAGVRFVSIPEAPKSMPLDVALAKRLTGNDTVYARGLYRDAIEYRPQFMMWMNTNVLPVVSDVSLFDGDRAYVVETRDTIPAESRDLTLKDSLKTPETLDAVLLWCINGLRLYRLDGGTPPRAVMEATARYRAKSDYLAQFLEDRATKDPDAIVRCGDLYSAYLSWCESNGYQHPLIKPSFVGELRDRGLYRDQLRHGGVRYTNVVVGYSLP